MSLARFEEPSRPTRVSVTPMVEGNSRLNQTLVKTAMFGRAIVPEIFPNLVRFEIVAFVE